MKKIVIAMILSLMVISCTDATLGKFGALGSSASVKCYSGGTIIYEGRSTGKVVSEANSDGYFFKDTKTGDMMEVSGNCVIIYD